MLCYKKIKIIFLRLKQKRLQVKIMLYGCKQSTGAIFYIRTMLFCHLSRLHAHGLHLFTNEKTGSFIEAHHRIALIAGLGI